MQNATIEESKKNKEGLLANRVYNFSPGPAMLPDEVMLQAQKEFLNWNNSGMSVMEMSHRSSLYIEIAEKAEQDLRDILNVPADYKILFLQGGGRGQYAMIPMNLSEGKKAGYVRTGAWSKMAAEEAHLYCPVEIVADSSANHYTTIPPLAEWKYDQDLAYLHYVDNETVHGVEFTSVPDVGEIPLAVDMSSNILSRPIDVTKYGILYACSQKNIGPAGITIVVVHEDLIERKILPTTPSIFRYKLQAEQDSMVNTPATYSWYMAGLVFQWIKKQGGLEVLGQRNLRKAQKLYQYIDQTDFYTNPVDPAYRSRMNVVFRTPTEELDSIFAKEATKIGLANLKGHRMVGGIRASLYNAMPEAGVDLLISFMRDFVERYG